MLFVVWSLLLGCVAPKVSDSGMGAGSDGSESVSGGCAVVETRTVSFDEDVGGYTAADVVGVVLGTHSTWARRTQLTLSLTGATRRCSWTKRSRPDHHRDCLHRHAPGCHGHAGGDGGWPAQFEPRGRGLQRGGHEVSCVDRPDVSFRRATGYGALRLTDLIALGGLARWCAERKHLGRCGEHQRQRV